MVISREVMNQYGSLSQSDSHTNTDFDPFRKIWFLFFYLVWFVCLMAYQDLSVI